MNYFHVLFLFHCVTRVRGRSWGERSFRREGSTVYCSFVPGGRWPQSWCCVSTDPGSFLCISYFLRVSGSEEVSFFLGLGLVSITICLSSIVPSSSFAPESLTGPICPCSCIRALACCRCGPWIAAILTMAVLWSFLFDIFFTFTAPI